MRPGGYQTARSGLDEVPRPSVVPDDRAQPPTGMLGARSCGHERLDLHGDVLLDGTREQMQMQVRWGRGAVEAFR